MQGLPTATDLIRRARAALLVSQPFFGTLAFGLEIVETVRYADGRPCETMGTDGRRLYVNPAFAAGLSDRELQAVLAHEIEHCARKHNIRRGARDRLLWNVACDYAINGDLVAAGFALPAGMLVDHAGEFAGLGAEGIYSVLYDRQNPEDAGEESSGEESADDDMADADDDGAPDAGGEDTGDDTGDGEASGGDATDDGNGEADGAQDPAPGGNGAGNATGAAGEQGAPAGADGPADPSAGAGGNASPPDGRNCDPGRCGEILDAAPDHAPADAAAVAADWDSRVRQALAVAKAAGAGTLPAELQTIADELRAPRIDPAETFRRFVDQSASRDFSWTTPSRRSAASGLAFLPGTVPVRPGHIVAVVDTSGSITKAERDKFAGFLQEALDAGAADRLTVVYADTRVQRADEYDAGDTLRLDSPAGGGTAFRQPLAWIGENIPDAAAIAYLTDLDASDHGEEPDAPLLWLVTGADPRTAAFHIARAPFGEAVHLDVHG